MKTKTVQKQFHASAFKLSNGRQNVSEKQKALKTFTEKTGDWKYKSTFCVNFRISYNKSKIFSRDK